MIRILFLFLLTLTLSCANTRPEPTAETSDSAVTPTAPAENPVKMAPEAVRKLEQIPPMKSWAEKAGVKSPAQPASKAKGRSNSSASKASPAAKSAPVKSNTPAADTTQVTAPAADTTQMSAPAAVPSAATAANDMPTEAAIPASVLVPAANELPLQVISTKGKQDREQRFLPTRRRIDREVNKLKFAYKGEVMMGLTASYGTLASDDTDFLTILGNIDAKATIASVKPFFGYFYRDNNCFGVRFGYSHTGGKVDQAIFDLGPSNNTSFDIPYIKLDNNNFSFGIFHRSYAGLDPKGRFGLFAEFELGVSTGSSEFTYKSEEDLHQTFSDNTQVKLSFNPGAAVYIFPNVCATLSFGLGGIQYTSVTQKDAEGNKIGSRKASNMKFKLNIAAINIGMTIHLWDKKKQ